VVRWAEFWGPGQTRVRVSEKRHGRALCRPRYIHDGSVAGRVTGSTRSDNFVEFLGDLVSQTPKGLDLHCIVDNLSAHSTDKVEAFLRANKHVHLQFTPTHASWLNQVELFSWVLDLKWGFWSRHRGG
jgi:putative transposase